LNYAGIDLGTTYTKTHSGLIFPSGISENICMSNNIMRFEGKQYTMGLLNDKADYEININKALNKNTKLNFVYALFHEARTIEYTFDNVIVGLPASQWKNTKTVNLFKEYLKIPELTLVNVNGLDKKIQAENLEIVPEGSTAYFAINYPEFNGRKVLVVDVGGITVNSIEFEDDSPIDMFTDEFGVLKVYKDMAERITTETGYNCTYEDMFDIITNGLSIKGQIIDIEEIIKPIALEHCKKIYKNLKLKWSIDTIPYVILVGAGAITLAKYIQYYIPNAQLQDNAQMLAAIGMGEMAGAYL